MNVYIHQKFENMLDDYYEVDTRDMKIIDISCGGHHSILLSSNGFVFTCGNNSYGQLGHKHTSSNLLEPTLVFSLTNKKVCQVQAGWNHSVALTSNSDVYTTGLNDSGQLGQNDVEKRIQFTWVAKLSGLRVGNIYAGGHHTWATLDSLNPVNRDYRPPSPLRSPAMTPIANRTRMDNTEDDISYYKNQKDSADYVFEDKVLNVIFSDNEMSHRFARLTIQSKHINDFQAQWEIFAKRIEEEEVGLIFNK